jgi:putative two-component system response regulator
MKRHILVVDDNITNLKQIGVLLSGSHEFSLCKSGEEAVGLCERYIPDLVLLDVEMPGMNGFETLAGLKSNPGMSGVPVIFLTSRTDAAAEITALESGAVDFIRKPADRDILLYRIGIHTELRNYRVNLERALKDMENSIASSFADLVESKDDHTGMHVLRTGRSVGIIGQRLLDMGLFGDELSEENLELMVRGAPFHDIGKLGVSDVILLKPGALTDEEYAEVKKHTTIGARVLNNIYQRTPEHHYLRYASMMAGGHHERYDGKGYPRGLKNTGIPLCCRLLAVANVYDACLTERIYRPALSPGDAQSVIVRGSGTEFDPGVVSAFTSAAGHLAALAANP